MTDIRIKVGDREMTVAEARDLYDALRKVFDRSPSYAANPPDLLRAYAAEERKVTSKPSAWEKFDHRPLGWIFS
jgi:hypothetical protein